jgi:hypothetical protein
MIATAFVENSTKELLAFLKCGNTMPTLTFKVTLDEARRIMAEARGKKMTLSDYIQGRALSDRKIVRTRASFPLRPHWSKDIFVLSRSTSPYN